MENTLTQGKTLLGQPLALYRLAYLQMWERFSYFGLRGLLVFFAIDHLGVNDAEAFGLYGLTVALCFVLPFLAGWLCDRYFEMFESAFIGGLLSLAGILVIFHSLVLGTALYIVGSSVFRPSALAMIGELYEENESSRSAGFAISHLYINLGAALAPLACGYVAETFGWSWGFGLAALGLLSGLAVLTDRRMLVLPVAFGKLGLMTYWLWIQLDFSSLKIGLLVALYLLTVTFLWAFIMLPVGEHEDSAWPHYGGISGLILLVSVTTGLLHYGLSSDDLGPTTLLVSVLAMAGTAWFFSQLRSAVLTQSQQGKSLFLFWAISGSVFAILSSSAQFVAELMDSYDYVFADKNTLLEIWGLFLLCVVWGYGGRFLSWRANNCGVLLSLGAGLLIIATGDYFSGWSGSIDGYWLVVGGWTLFLGELVLLPFVESALTKLAPEGAKRTTIGAWLASMVGVRYLSAVFFQVRDFNDLALAGGMGVLLAIVCYGLGKRL